MSTKNEILNELKELQISIPIDAKPLLTVPDGYFNQLHNNILANIKQHDFLQSLPTETPYNIPTGYFQQFETELLDTIHIESILANLPKSVPYSIPNNYFETLTQNIIAQKVVVKPLSPLRATRTFYSHMAIAASLFIILTLGFVFLTHQSATTKMQAQITRLSDAEINEYMTTHAYEFDQHISYQAIDENNIDINKLENDIYDDYLKNISNEELLNLL